MRGRAMRHLLHPEQPVPDRSEMIADAARLSLKRAQSDGQNYNATTLQGGLQMSEPNTDQTTYWNQTDGRTWAEAQEPLERQLPPLGRAAMHALTAMRTVEHTPDIQS